MKDFIPSADDQFNHWSSDLTDYLANDPDAPVLDAATKALLISARSAWSGPYDEHLTAQQEALIKAQAKEDARTVYTEILRQIIGDLQRAPATTDSQRVAMKITVPKEGRTPVGEIESHPLLNRIDTSTRLRHRIFFADSDTPDSAAKPAGAKFCEIRLQLAGTAPTNPDDMDSLALESRSPHRNDFDPGDEGKTAYYAARWINTRGEKGPWGPIVTAIVPA